MADTSNLSNYLKDLADAIRTKKEATEPIPAADFDTEILSIETGIDTSDADALSSQILQGKTAYVNDEKIVGTLLLNEDQIAVGVDEVKTNYVGVPNNIDVSYDNSPVNWNCNGNRAETQYNCFYSIEVPYIFTYAGSTTINIYNKSFVLLNTIDVKEDIGATTAIGSPSITITASMINNVCYLVIYGMSSQHSTKIGLYKQINSTSDFELIDTIDNIERTGRALLFSTVEPDMLISANGKNVYKIVNDKLVEQSYTFGNFGTTSGSYSYFQCEADIAFVGDYIFSRIGSNQIDSNSLTTYIVKYSGETRLFRISSTNILDITESGKLARYDNNSKKIKFYEISNGGSLTEKSYYIDNSFYDDTSYYHPTLRFIDDNTVMLAVSYGARYEYSSPYVKFQLVHIGEDGVNVIKEIQYTNPNSPTTGYIFEFCRYGQIYENQYLFLAKSQYKSYTIDLRELINKVYSIEDKDGVKYYPYDNAAQLDDLSKVLENSGTVIYKNGLGTGTMPNNGELNYNSSTSTQTIPAGYTSGGTIAPAPLTDTEYNECLELSKQILGENVSL